MAVKRFNFKYILLSIFVLSALILSFFAFKPKIIVKADDVTNSYQYTGSSIFVPYFSNYIGEDENEAHYHYAEKGFLNFSVDFTQSSYNQLTNIRFHIDKFYEKDDYNNSNSSTFVSRPNQYVITTASLGAVESSNHVQTLSIQYIPLASTNEIYELGARHWIGDSLENSQLVDGNMYNQFYLICSNRNFNGGVTQIKIGSFPASQAVGSLYQPFESKYDYINYIRYIDINGQWLQFMFPTRSSYPIYGLPLPMVFSERTYYTNLWLDNNLSYNEGYEKGLQDGEDIGYTEGYRDGSWFEYNRGFDDGYDEGLSDYTNTDEYKNAILEAKNEGYQNGFANYPNSPAYKNSIESAKNTGYSNGYTDGLNEGAKLGEGNYDFTRAVSTLIGAPLDITSRMLNFNLLGVNVWVIVSSLFTLLFIIKLIKIFI